MRDADDGSTVHHLDAIDLKSLAVVAGLFYFTAFLVLALAIVAVWLFAASLGLISQVEDFMRSVGFRGFRLVGPEVVLGFVLILLALVVFLTVMTLVAGAFYNILGVGRRGIRIRTSVESPESAPATETSATPLVFEPVPEGEQGNGVESDDQPAPAEVSSDDEAAEPEEPEAVAG